MTLPKAPTYRAGAAVLVALAIGLVTTGCTEDADALDTDGLAQIRVEIVDDSALGEAPFEFVSTYTKVTIAVEAIGHDGQRLTSYNGTLSVSSVPGEIQPGSDQVALTDGYNGSHDVNLRYVFGDAYIWVEDIGLERGDECRDGFDNDGDGLLDYPGDPGCDGTSDPSEGTASYVTGLSDVLAFRGVTIHDVQLNASDPVGESPLLGSEVRVERGDLLVTNVIENGFYVTDVADDRGYNGMFVFNFSFPEGIAVGDKLLWFSGGVAEFQGDTQVTFPSWEHDPSYDPSDAQRSAQASCMPPDDPDFLQPQPRVLSPSDLNDLELLESEESNVVRVNDVDISTRFINCDFDFNGDIDGPDEQLCRSECQATNRCTELSSFVEFGQFVGGAGGATVDIANADQVANFDVLADCTVVAEFPLEYECPARRLASVTGNLRHVFLTRSIQLWILLPRFACDFVFACDTPADCPDDQICTSDNICESES